MAGQFHSPLALLLNLKPYRYIYVGAKFYGLVWGRWPILAFVFDESYYHTAESYALAIGPFSIGLFWDRTDHKPRLSK